MIISSKTGDFVVEERLGAVVLFDVDVKLVKTLAREQKIGARDAVIRPVALGPNSGTYVGAKTMRAVDFLKLLEKQLPKIDLDLSREEDDFDDDEEDLGADEDAEDDSEDE